MQRLIIGTYPAGAAAGSGEGLWEVFLDAAAGTFSRARQLAQTPSPSFVALHPDGKTLFAVTELDDGAVTSFTLADGSLEERETRSTGGVHPCHVVARENEVWVANYSSGTFTALGLDDDVAFTGEVRSFGHVGSGPDEDRQEGPHAHFCLPAPSGDGAWVVDLGTDEIRRYTPDLDPGETTGALVAGNVAATLPAGAGPRHAAAHPAGTVFVVGELDSRVHVLRPAAAVDPEVAHGGAQERAWTVVASVPACMTPDPGPGSYPSHVALSPDGTRLYVAVRGPDVLSTFAVTGGAAPELTHLADTPIGGVWPRHFAVLPGAGGDTVVVANQNSSNLSALRIDPVAGSGELVAALDLPAPACVLPV